MFKQTSLFWGNLTPTFLQSAFSSLSTSPNAANVDTLTLNGLLRCAVTSPAKFIVVKTNEGPLDFPIVFYSVGNYDWITTNIQDKYMNRFTFIGNNLFSQVPIWLTRLNRKSFQCLSILVWLDLTITVRKKGKLNLFWNLYSGKNEEKYNSSLCLKFHGY